MISKVLGAGLFTCLILSAAWAQDPTKVEPKHYKLAFENESVQVVNVHYGPHEKSGIHDHPGGVVVVISSGHLKFTDDKGKTQEVFAKQGESRWFPPFKHKVENLGETDYNAVYIGIKTRTRTAKVDSTTQQPLSDAQTQQLVAEYIFAALKR